MKAKVTVRKELEKTKRLHFTLQNLRAQDQAYGVMEALRWILDEGPPPHHLAEEWK